jgi:hypothetical protein
VVLQRRRRKAFIDVAINKHPLINANFPVELLNLSDKVRLIFAISEFGPVYFPGILNLNDTCLVVLLFLNIAMIINAFIGFKDIKSKYLSTERKSEIEESYGKIPLQQIFYA